MNPSTESKFSMITLDNLFHLLCDGLSKNKVLTVWVLFFSSFFCCVFFIKIYKHKTYFSSLSARFSSKYLVCKKFLHSMNEKADRMLCMWSVAFAWDGNVFVACHTELACVYVCVCVMKVIQIIEMRIQVSHIIWFNAFQSIHSNSLFCARDVLHFNEFSFSFNCWNKVWRWHVLMLLI